MASEKRMDDERVLFISSSSTSSTSSSSPAHSDATVHASCSHVSRRCLFRCCRATWVPANWYVPFGCSSPPTLLKFPVLDFTSISCFSSLPPQPHPTSTPLPPLVRAYPTPHNLLQQRGCAHPHGRQSFDPRDCARSIRGQWHCHQLG